MVCAPPEASAEPGPGQRLGGGGQVSRNIHTGFIHNAQGEGGGGAGPVGGPRLPAGRPAADLPAQTGEQTRRGQLGS